MRIFLVTITAGEKAHELARKLILECGAEDYASAEEFWPDGVQDPYRAVLEADAIIWLYKPHTRGYRFSRTDFNPLYGDGIFLTALNNEKVVLYYEFASKVQQTSPAIMRKVARRKYGVPSLKSFADLLRKDLSDLMAGKIKYTEAPLKVFLCHSKQDKDSVRKTRLQLLERGIQPWFDEEDLIGGVDWELEIRRAVKSSHAILVFLSNKWLRTAGFAHKEIKLALDVADHQPEGSIFIIPLRLDECEVPDRLRTWQWIDIFTDDGFEKLVKALRRRADELGIVARGFD
ncbi:toll/interleukin-1 receptor domain-containing protein [Acidicapsa acidisoli]|uniref:toll/interleukin-1 receptor domain-containing protein n=1 Tax=Acidicapsa acidisoli TaxID=1615681 RepID=UPI0021E06B5A|nr:toll/interleukin-1 receptor domain-containing protein [Acidicapsa acidisoli]